MKKVLLAFIVLFLANCRNDAAFKNVALKSTIMDRIYAGEKKNLDQICNKILAIDEIRTDFERPLIIRDSTDKNVDDDEVLKIASLKVDSTFLSSHEPFSNSNTIYVNRYTNLSQNSEMKPDTVYADKNYKFDIELFSPALTLTSLTPTIWKRHQSKNYSPDLTDSVTQNTVDDLKQSNNEYLQNVRKAKYAVFVQDLYYLRPRLIDKKTFEGGILVTNVKIYNLLTGEKTGQTTLFVTSSEKVSNDVNLFDYTQFNKILIEENMAKERISAIDKFLKTGKAQTIK